MPTFTLYNSFAGKLGDGTIDNDGHTFKAALTNAAPDATNDELVDITQIANGNGYATGGVTLTNVTWTSPSSAVWRFDADDFSWTSTGAGMAAFRTIVVYDDTATGDPLVGYIDYGSSTSLPVGATVTAVLPANGFYLATKSP